MQLCVDDGVFGQRASYIFVNWPLMLFFDQETIRVLLEFKADISLGEFKVTTTNDDGRIGET